MRVTLLLVFAMLLTGCASTQQALPVPAGTFWGYTAESSPGEPTLVVTTDLRVCESAHDADIKRVAGTPTQCRALTLARGSDFWIVPAVNLPAGSYWGARNRVRCEGVERLQSPDFGLSTRECQAVRVEFRQEVQ
jgi:hypothetical protein